MKHRDIVPVDEAGDGVTLGNVAGDDLHAGVPVSGSAVRDYVIEQHDFIDLLPVAGRAGELSGFENAAGQPLAEKAETAGDDNFHGCLLCEAM